MKDVIKCEWRSGRDTVGILKEMRQLKKAKFIKNHHKLILISEMLNKAILNKLKRADFKIR